MACRPARHWPGECWALGLAVEMSVQTSLCPAGQCPGLMCVSSCDSSFLSAQPLGTQLWWRKESGLGHTQGRHGWSIWLPISCLTQYQLLWTLEEWIGRWEWSLFGFVSVSLPPKRNLYRLFFKKKFVCLFSFERQRNTERERDLPSAISTTFPSILEQSWTRSRADIT